MPRRPIVIAILALLAAALLVPIVLLITAGPAAEAPGRSDEPPAAEVVRPADVGWVYAPWVFAQPKPVYILQAGTLADAAPALDFEVPWVVDAASQIGRAPAVGPYIDGSVVYVSDDGASSEVRRVAVAPVGADERVAALSEIVWSMAVTRDASHAYLALIDRDDPEVDLGVVRLALDGSGEVEQIMGPARAAANGSAHRLAAVIGFGVDLRLSIDGRHLIRRACHAGGCESDLLDLESGAATELGTHEVIGVAGGIVVSQRCDEVDCWLEATDTANGNRRDLRALGLEATVTLFGGRPTILFIEPAADASGALRALDLGDGQFSDLLRAPQGSLLTLAVVPGDVRVSMPAGHMLIAMWDANPGAGQAFQNVSIPLGGGEPVELPLLPIRQPQPVIQG